MSELERRSIFQRLAAQDVRSERRKRLSRFYYDYRSEFVFGIVLSAFVVVSYWLSQFIPVDMFEDVISPMQNACLLTVCACGAWLLLRHNEGIQVRKTWAHVLILWGTLELLLLVLSLLYDIPVVKAGDSPLRGSAMVLGNMYAWMLLVYPTEVLRPGWLNVWRSLLQILPLPLLAVLDYIFQVDLRWLIALYPMFLLCLLLAHVRAYRKWCEDNYSSMENIEVQWVVRYMVMLFIVGASYYYVCFSHEPSRVFTQQLLLFFMMAYSTGQILYRHDPWEGLKHNEVEEKEETINEDESTAYCAKLEAWMEEEKPWLNPEFRLMDLRRVLPLNRTYLSQLINAKYGCNFYQFVTNYRIEEAKRLMRENPRMKIQDIAQQCGFSSPTIFTRVFAREIGETPKSWSKKNDNS